MTLRGPCSGSRYGGAESGRRRRPLSPSPGEAVPGGTVTEVNGTEVTAWRLTGDLDGDGRAEGLCHSQFLTGDMWVVLETESRASAGAEEPWEEAARWSDSFLSAVLQGEGDALTLDHLLEAEP